jgi:hypothetical protein
MQPSELVSALEAIAAKLGVPIRYDVFDPGLAKRRSVGGLCRLRGQPIIVLDASLDAREHVATLAHALAAFDLGAMYLPPPVRRTIRAHDKARVMAPRPLARVKPRSP